jgi:ATP-binding cassette, subfamily C (CFTR/MRP), member 1
MTNVKCWPRMLTTLQALARALYSRKRLVFLDDSLSGLDNVTGQLVFERVLGAQGLFRQQKMTIICATDSGNFPPLK